MFNYSGHILTTDEKPFPIVVQFPRVRGTREFESPESVRAWINEERNVWARFANAGGEYAGVFRNQINLLGALESSLGKDPNDARKALQEFAAGFVSLTTGVGKALPAFLSNTATDAASRWALVGLVGSADMGWNPSDPQRLDGRMIANAIRVIAAPSDYENRVVETGEALDAVLKRGHSIVGDLANFQSGCEKEWTDRIEGYETKVALRAPRTFWNDRKTAQGAAARTSRIVWYLSLIGYVAVLVGLLVRPELSILQTASPGADSTVILADRIYRAVLIGSLLAVGAWWLRQTLRELRAHEHLEADAAERVTMIETYAAMRGAGLQGGDLSPILSALYRPTNTGMVADSGPILPLEVAIKQFANARESGGN